MFNNYSVAQEYTGRVFRDSGVGDCDLLDRCNEGVRVKSTLLTSGPVPAMG